MDTLNKMVRVEAMWWWNYLNEVQGYTEASVGRLMKSFNVNSAIMLTPRLISRHENAIPILRTLGTNT